MDLPGWRADFAGSPLFRGLESLAGRFAGNDGFPDLTQLDALATAFGIRNADGLPIRFVAQSARCSQRAYEDGIHASGQVPTRQDNWHDFFNALIWLAWPATKAALNACQHGGLEQLADGRRGPVSDAATLFDESGLVLVAPDATLAELLRAKRWREAFWEQRKLWTQARAYVIGHSLLEKAVALAPTPGITGKCLFIATEAAALDPARLDQLVAEAWQQGRIHRPADLFPLPVFGIPGYHPGNDDPGFYADTQVFRPARAATCTAP
jgi:hypothetical protein